MSVKIVSVGKQLPKYVKKTEEIIPFVKQWIQGQESRFQRKVLKLFEGAGVDKRYSITVSYTHLTLQTNREV